MAEIGYNILRFLIIGNMNKHLCKVEQQECVSGEGCHASEHEFTAKQNPKGLFYSTGWNPVLFSPKPLDSRHGEHSPPTGWEGSVVLSAQAGQ